MSGCPLPKRQLSHRPAVSAPTPEEMLRRKHYRAEKAERLSKRAAESARLEVRPSTFHAPLQNPQHDAV